MNLSVLVVCYLFLGIRYQVQFGKERNKPIRPVTPGTISSLLSSIGLGGILCVALFLLHSCNIKAAEVEESDKVMPRIMPHTRSRVNFEGKRSRSQNLDENAVK